MIDDTFEEDEKDIFNIEVSVGNFDTWTSKEFVSNDIKDQLKNASILLIPTLGYYSQDDQSEPTFPVGTEHFLAYLKENLPDEISVDICIDDDLFYELSLHSDVKRMGRFLVKGVALTIFLNVLSSYIYDHVTKHEDSKPVIVIVNNAPSHTQNPNTQAHTYKHKAPKKFMEAPKVEFSITVVDSNGTSKEFHYKGDAKDVKTVTERIKDLWQDEHSEPEK